MSERSKSAKQAAEALSDLNSFAIVVSILEGSHIHAASQDAARKIIQICKTEQQKLLRQYDLSIKATE